MEKKLGHRCGEPRMNTRTTLASLAVMFAATATGHHATPPDPSHCDEGADCPVRHDVHGFATWVSPTVYAVSDFSNERLGATLDAVNAQIEAFTGDRQMSDMTMARLREAGLKFYMSGPAMDDWMSHDCELVACYSPDQRTIYINQAFIDGDTARQNVTLHELAHAVHHLLIHDGFDNACVKSIFQRNRHRYESVLLHWAQVDTDYHHAVYTGEHWAHIDHREYFAEGAEAWFVLNNYYPFHRYDLYQHDKELYHLMSTAWSGDDLATYRGTDCSAQQGSSVAVPTLAHP